MSAVLTQNTAREFTRIMGVGAARGDVVVTNEDVCQWIDSSDEWIQKRTGIVTRRRADAETSLLDPVSYTHLTLPTILRV